MKLEFYEGRKVLITGHKGVIGSHLWSFIQESNCYGEWQNERWDLYGLDFPDDIGFFKPKEKYDYVIHLAAFAALRESFEDPDRFWENNVEKYARSHGHTFIIRDEDLTYNPQNEIVGENILVKRFKVKQGSPLHVQELEKAIGSIADVLRKTNAKIARRVYKTAFRQKVGELQLVYPFSSWERFEDGTQGLPADFWESYEKINGRCSQQKNVGDVIEKHSNGITNEVMTMVK